MSQKTVAGGSHRADWSIVLRNVHVRNPGFQFPKLNQSWNTPAMWGSWNNLSSLSCIGDWPELKYDIQETPGRDTSKTHETSQIGDGNCSQKEAQWTQTGETAQLFQKRGWKTTGEAEEVTGSAIHTPKTKDEHRAMSHIPNSDIKLLFAVNDNKKGMFTCAAGCHEWNQQNNTVRFKQWGLVPLEHPSVTEYLLSMKSLHFMLNSNHFKGSAGLKYFT